MASFDSRYSTDLRIKAQRLSSRRYTWTGRSHTGLGWILPYLPPVPPLLSIAREFWTKPSDLFNNEDETEDRIQSSQNVDRIQSSQSETTHGREKNKRLLQCSSKTTTQRKIQADARCCQQIIEEWGESLAASEAVPDDKNSISTTGEKLNISDWVF